MYLKHFSSFLFILNLFVITASQKKCDYTDDCFIHQYLRLKSDGSNRFDPNGNQEMNDFFRSSGNCSNFFETVDDEESKLKQLKIDLFSIKSYIRHHYATTYVWSLVTNPENRPAEAVFSIFLPRNAFISNFIMEIDGKLHKARIVKRIDSPSTHYKDQDNLRNFHISTKLRPNSTVNFYLIYEQLLKRTNGRYEQILHIHPGKPIEHLNAEVYIHEDQPLTFIEIPLLKKTTDIHRTNPKLDTNAIVTRINPNVALIQFQPSQLKQKEFAKILGMKPSKGLDAIFSVRYDVQRDALGGILLTDGYHFVHFFAPNNLQPLPKHVTFVLDTSFSMDGKRIEQLINAMKQILPQLKPDDLFNIIQFESNVYVGDNKNRESFTKVLDGDKFKDYHHFDNAFKHKRLPVGVPATTANIVKAIKDVESLKADGGTNLIGGVLMSLLIIKRTRKSSPHRYEPLVILITDGEPNVGLSSHDEITKLVTEYNSNMASIFCLGLGKDADYLFLKKLAALNHGTDKFIADIDTSIQLQGFFKEISSPILDNINFKYGTDWLQLTNSYFPIFFNGSELVVAGKLNNSNILPSVSAWAKDGHRQFSPYISYSPDSLDRIWSYLKLTQSLNKMNNHQISDDFVQEAMNLALKYSFVSPLTSLMIHKPNDGLIYDNSMLTPPYKPCRNLYFIPVTTFKAEIRQPKCPIELSKSATIWLKKIPRVVRNAFINILPKLFESMFK